MYGEDGLTSSRYTICSPIGTPETGQFELERPSLQRDVSRIIWQALLMWPVPLVMTFGPPPHWLIHCPDSQNWSYVAASAAGAAKAINDNGNAMTELGMSRRRRRVIQSFIHFSPTLGYTCSIY